MTETRAAEALAGYIVQERFDRLPPEVVQRAKDCVQEAVACILAAHAMPDSAIIRKFAGERGGHPEAHVLGTGLRTACTTAAFANAVLQNTLDFDDIYRKGHLGATAVAAAFAVGEKIGCNGRDLIAALVVGYEVSGRVGMSLRHLKPRKTIHGHGTWQTFGAAAAAARLLRLDESRAAHALAIAGANAPVASVMKTVYGEGEPTMAKNNFGPAAETGVTAALLAADGFAGPIDIFEGDSGFWRMFGADEYDPAALCGGLGRDYEMLHVGFKPYSCCRILQGSVEAAVAACAQRDLDARRDIGKIELTVPPIVCEWPFNNTRPTSLWSAQFSAPYVVAVALLGVPPGPEWFSEARFRDPDVLALMDRIALRAVDESMTSHGPGAEATVHTRGGEALRASVGVARGEAANPMTKTQRDRKFRSLAQQRMMATQADALLNRIQTLETEATLEPLVQAMAPAQE
jgi:2-methylcitrate dehydratase PrpD